MQFSMRADSLLERAAVWFNLGPIPIAQAFFGMMGARTAMAGVRLGVLRTLAEQRAPRATEALAAELKLSASGLEHLLSALASLQLVRHKSSGWTLARRARPWLDPSSPTYVGDFLEFNYAQWDWWSRLEDVVTRGSGFEIHDFGPEDPRWRQYIVAMFQLARLAAPEVARAIRLPRRPRRLLDLGGAHGWFSAELCRRHPSLSATVLDLPGSARVGRELIAHAGMSTRVAHLEANVLTADLGTGVDGVLCFQLLHHLKPDDARALVNKVARALRPGGTFAVLELFDDDATKPDASAMLALHYFITSQASTYRRAQIEQWMRDAGLTVRRAVPIRRMPLMTLLTATRPG